MLDNNGYRLNVGIILLNHANQVFWGKRKNEDSWQFPQGGVLNYEKLEEAMYRELYEEVGLIHKHVDIIARTKDWLFYDVPNSHKKLTFKGQKQIWYLLRFIGEDSDINIKSHKEQEFDAWRWVNYWQCIDEVIYFKYAVYHAALTYLAKFIHDNKKLGTQSQAFNYTIKNNCANSLFLDTIEQKSHKINQQIPVWFMRQAGRYLPEYQKIRAQAGNFMNLCKNPELACEVTLQPLKRFNLDAAILFSDILVIPDAMGLGLDFTPNHGPRFSHKISTIDDINNLPVIDVNYHLAYVFAAIKNIKIELKPHIPLIGFSGSPFTLACYMLEGGSSKDFLLAKTMLINNPIAMHQLLQKLTNTIINYLKAQIVAGVDILMLFDSWGGILSAQAYQEFSLSYMQQILSALQINNIPIILFTKGGGLWLQDIVIPNDINKVIPDVIGLDWMINLAKARQLLPHTTLQGNLDPMILATANKDTLKYHTYQILNTYKNANNNNTNNYIFNLGHGMLPMTNPDNVAYLVDLVHEFHINNN